MSKSVAGNKLAQIVKSDLEQHPDVLAIDARDVPLADIGFAFPCQNAGMATPIEPGSNAADVCAPSLWAGSE